MKFAQQHLSDLAIALPMATEIFRKNRLDFCCGGKQTLQEACEKKGIDVNTIEKQLESLSPNATPGVETMPLEKLTEHIVDRYHTDLRRRLPELKMLAGRVEQVHGDHPACPRGLLDLLTEMDSELQMHMMKEENVLFPMIKQGKGPHAVMPIKVMTAEHDDHGQQLDDIRRLTSDMCPPEGACGTWRALYSGLEKLEEELMEHIHLENNVLFPNALKAKE